MTQYPHWLNIQRGCLPADTQQYDPVRRYNRTGRDKAQWVHADVLYQLRSVLPKQIQLRRRAELLQFLAFGAVAR